MLPVFAFTLFLSSALLFVVEPMFAKMVLPLLGSTPAVWNTAVLFFQGALLAGYGYAHASTRLLGSRRQAALHVLILSAPLLLLPIGIPLGWIPPSGRSPVAWLLLVMLVAVGLPFLVVSTTAPLLQRWFASTGHPRASDPYFLYRASNLGSAVGLLGYPIVLEPVLGLSQQARAWTVGYAGFMAVAVLSAVFVWRSGAADADARPGRLSATESVPALSVRRRVRWIALAFVPSSLMLGVTSYLTTNIAPIPLLWVIPLTLYLVSFVVVFSPRAESVIRLGGRILPLAVLPTILTIVLEGGRPLWLIGALHVLTFFLAAVVCHGELARDRPASAHLTEFYLWIAVGGVMGGVFNAVIAPVVFDSFAEYPLVMVLALLFRPKPAGGPSDTTTRRVLDIALPAGLGLVTLLLGVIAGGADPGAGVLERALLVGLPAACCVAFLARPVRYGLGIGALVLATSLAASTQSTVLHAERTFFGIHRVEADPQGRFHLLLHGTTIHGAQSLDPARREEPLTYYTAEGPLGQVIEAYRASAVPRSVAVVGLGSGSMACFSRPGERWTFYEIDPEVVRIARDPRLFTFVRDCLNSLDVVVGDARLSLARGADGGRYGLLAIDAFNSDAIPIHLLTREALDIYLSRLADHGLLAFHVSNNYVNLHPVLANLAADAGLVAYARDEQSVAPVRALRGAFPSDWVVMARETGDLHGLVDDPRWRRLGRQQDFPVWTDDFSNVLRVLRLG